MLPRLLEKFLESENLVCNATTSTKAVGIHEIRFNNLAASFCLHWTYTFFREIKVANVLLIGAFLPVSFIVYELLSPYSANPSQQCRINNSIKCSNCNTRNKAQPPACNYLEFVL